MMINEIRYGGNGIVTVAVGNGRVCKIKHGDLVKRGDIPNDAFDALAIRPDFGGDLDTYRKSIGALGGETADPVDGDQPQPEDVE